MSTHPQNGVIQNAIWDMHPLLQQSWARFFKDITARRRAGVPSMDLVRGRTRPVDLANLYDGWRRGPRQGDVRPHRKSFGKARDCVEFARWHDRSSSDPFVYGFGFEVKWFYGTGANRETIAVCTEETRSLIGDVATGAGLRIPLQQALPTIFVHDKWYEVATVLRGLWTNELDSYLEQEYKDIEAMEDQPPSRA